jgi:cytochrome P450
MRIDTSALDPERIRNLFDLRRNKAVAGSYEDDPYPAWHALREERPLHEGTVGRLIGYDGPELFFGLPEPDRLHYSAFDFDTCDQIVRNPQAFWMSPPDREQGLTMIDESMLTMDGARHRRYRSLVQPAFGPDRMPWWTRNWVEPIVEALIDSFESKGRADLNVEFFAAIPTLTICGSFGIPVEKALDIREAVSGGSPNPGEAVQRFMGILKPIVDDRRANPQDDLISLLVAAQLDDEVGESHVLADKDILGFSYLLLSAGSGTTWKQMGITMTALFQNPKWLEAVRSDPELLAPVVEESARWAPTDPVFSRYVHEPVTLAGIEIPVGAVVHQCYGAANRDPKRWERPDEFDPGRPNRANLAFGRGPHMCLGKNLARNEISFSIKRLLERLPNLRPDPDAEPARIIGLYERAATAVPAIWG